jgi:solute carrier family 1 (high affinity glutamate transporter) protein 1
MTLRYHAGDARNTGRLATLAISFYLFTTVIAATCGIAWVMLFRPGQDVAPDPNQPPITNTPKTPLESIVGILKGLFPANLFQAAAEMNIPGIVTFAVILGIALLHLGDAGKPLVRFFHSLNAAIIQIVQYSYVL